MTVPTSWNAFRCGALLLGLTAAASLRASDDSTPASQVPYFRDLAWTGAAYVGVETDAIHTSTDGVTWTTVHPSPDHGIHLVAAGNGRVVVAGDGVLLTATGAGPALKFSERNVPDAKFTQLAFGGGKFVALDEAGRAHVSDGAAAWKVATVATDFEMKGVAFGGGVWVAVGNNGRTGAAIFTSKDPAGAWPRGTIPSDTGPYGIAYGNGQFLIVGYAGLLLTSRDGVAWEGTNAPDIASSNDITGVFAAGDNFYVLGEGMFSPTKDGEWLRLPQVDSSYLQTPLVRDGKLVVVFQGGDDSRALLPIEEVVRHGIVQMSNWSEGEVEVEPAGFNLVVVTPVRLTAFEGANVNRLAVNEDTLYAATSKGLFKSSDGQKWERFGGIAIAVDFVAATGDQVVIATKDGLSGATRNEGKFTPIAKGRFKVRDLRGSDGRFAALGEGTKLLFGTADGWREATLEGATNILSIEASKNATCTIFADTAAGLRQFYVDAAETRSSWTPLRGLKSARLIYNTFVLLDGANGVTFGSIAENGTAQHVDLPGRVTEFADSTDSGYWIVTSRGLVAGVSDEKLWKLHVADGAVLTTIVDAGSSVVAGGQGGVIVIVPKPADDAPAPVALASTTVNLMPADMTFPTGVRLHVLGEHRGTRIQRVKTAAGKIYGILANNGGCVTWGDAGWTDVVFSYSVRLELRDFVVVDDRIAAIKATTIEQTTAGDRNGSSQTWDFAIAGQTPDFRRIYHANGTYLVLGGRNGVGVASYPGSLTPQALGSDDTAIRDAAWGNGVWVLVGAQGDGGNAPAVFAGADRSSLIPVRTPAHAGALHAVIFDGKRFVAVGDRGNVLSSKNGVDWQAYPIDGAPALREIAFGAGQFGVVTEAGAILVSDDLALWGELPRDPQFVFQHVAGTAESLIALGSEAALVCQAPPAVWQAKAPVVARELKVEDSIQRVAALTASKVADGSTVFNIVWDGRQFLATAYQGVWASPDGRAFSKIQGLSDSRDTDVRMAFGRPWLRVNNHLYARGIHRDDFSSVKATNDGALITDFAANENSLAFVTATGDVISTADHGATWKDAPRPGLDAVTAIAWGGGRWVAIGTRTAGGATVAAVSTDLQSWKLFDVPDHAGSFEKLVYGHGRFVGAGGATFVVASSPDGEHWETRQLDNVRWGTLACLDGTFYLAQSDRLLVSDDGLAWRDLGIAPRFSVNGLTAMAGMLYLVGHEKDGANFARLPAPTAAQFAAAREIKSVPFEGFARAIADWDAGMTAATNSEERLKLCQDLHRAWRNAHPSYTTEAALEYLQGMYDRVLAHETSDHTVYQFVSDLGDFSQEFMKAFAETLPLSHRDLVKQIANDLVADYNAKWTGKPTDHPARVQAHATPAQPQKSPAEMNVDALRLRAACGDKVAAYDLNYAYRVGEGVPLDLAAANYWLASARRAGFATPNGSFKTPEETFAAYRLLADQGSANFQYRIGLACRDGVGTTTDSAEAVRWLQRAIAGGHWGAGLELASIYRSGKGIKMDLTASLRLLEQTAALGHARSMAEIGWTYEVACGVPRDLAKAANYYQKAIDLGNAWAVVRLANLYLVGEGLAKDEARARAILQRAADAGDDPAKTALADLATGKYVSRLLAAFVPPHKAPAIFDVAMRRAKAEAGDPAACYDLAYACWNNYGIEPADNLGDEWLAKAKARGLKYANQWDTPEEATATWKELADQGSIVAHHALGLRHRDGTGTPVDHTAANAAFNLAIVGGNWEAYVELAAQQRYGRGVKADPTAALQLLEQGAALGHARSIAELGWTYEAACGVKRDLAKAAQHYQRAADLDQTWAMRRLADCYLAGQGVAKDELKAKTLLEKAATLGDLNADPVLAQLADKKHTPRALASYTLPKPLRPIFDVAARRAKAEAGDAAASYDMAYITWKGYGVEADNNAGNQWLAKAKAKGWKDPEKWDTPENVTASWRALADQGSLVGMDTFARRLKSGEGIAADLADSNARFLKAADAGNFDAQAEVGLFYENGRGTIAIDDAKAIEWYRRAADGGNAFAQMKIGYRSGTGIGVPKDDSNAVRYYKLAAEGGNETAAANLAQMLFAADPKAAAGWYLELAGLRNEPTEPAAAYAQIKDAIATGNLEALGALAIMTRRGFGTTADANEAWALAYASEEFETAIYPFSWFNDDSLVKPAALRRGARLVRDTWKTTMAELYEKLFAEGRQADTSEIARALRALEAGTVTDEQIAAVAKSVEPLRIYGLQMLWQKAKTEKSPAGQPWALRLAGLAEKPADGPAAENAFVSAALYTPDEDDEAGRERIIALRAIQVARLYYGIGIKADGPAALAWALLNEEATDSFLPIAFLAEPLSSDELARADARYLGLVAQQRRQLADIINLGNDSEAQLDAIDLYRSALQRAADAGDLPSIIKMAEHHETETFSFIKDPVEIAALRRDAAQLGDPESMFLTGVAMFADNGPTRDETAARAWIVKAAAAGHPNAATTLAGLVQADARAALRTPPDKKSGPVDAVVFKALTDLQNDTATTTLGEPAIVALLKAVWWDADYSSLDEDLARELNDATARPLVVTATDGRTLSFTKTIDASVAVVFPQFLQGEFNVLNGEYYKQVWLKTVIAGVFLGGCHVNDNGRIFMRGRLAENIFDGVKFAAGQGGASFEQIFGALKTAHDTANPALQAEFRGEVCAAIALVEQAGHVFPPTWKEAAWMKEPAAVAP